MMTYEENMEPLERQMKNGATAVERIRLEIEKAIQNGEFGAGQRLTEAALVRRQSYWASWRPDLREGLAHLVGLIMRRICGEASAGFRWSFV